jgi:hypothetical protein
MPLAGLLSAGLKASDTTCRAGRPSIASASRRGVPIEIVEVRRDGYSVAAEMGQMRGWLNARRIVPWLFQFDGAVLRLAFNSGGEATAFADAFDGRVLSETDARAALDV